MNLDEAIAVFDMSAERTRPNKQTEAWTVIRAAIALMRGQSDIEETIQAMDVVSLADLVDAAVCLERCEAAWCGDEMELAAPRRRLARAYSGIRRTLFTAQDAIECALRNSKRGSRTNAECTTALAFLRRATKQSDDTIPVQPKDTADEQ